MRFFIKPTKKTQYKHIWQCAKNIRIYKQLMSFDDTPEKLRIILSKYQENNLR